MICYRQCLINSTEGQLPDSLQIECRFHKEELAGERANYVHNRSYIEEKAPLDVLAEMGHELYTSRKAVYTALAPCPGAIDAWYTWEQGYVYVPLSCLGLVWA